YSFLDGTARQQAKVTQVIQEWSLYANITFAYVASPSDSDLRITFNPKGGSWSYVGTDNEYISTSQANMNLGWVEDSGRTNKDGTIQVSSDEHGVILHEFGHVLGLMHEHQSPARG
ncbi:hypothetical protein B0H13DRAFT_1527444, partial [Mycena leptocephala]